MQHHEQAYQVRRMMDQGYATSITIEQLSKAVALSPFYLIRLFRHIYKQTPHQYLIHLRIARAKELLRNSDLSIMEICMAVGYESLGSFSTLFRKVAGLSPSAYRVCSRPTCTSTYIPLCVCVLHNIEDRPNR
ncbi:MAG: hypothetical protein GFH27_549303n113 [Chloroflexi bacterium AL-W]|nr:hypothetical protein [Chloroflexi bacterium AL-N1]NOK67998.1 hypothetical protein [Chloroflexi bacterium AL-N10]NOK73338.1 hypothetical protein [Chloroflexi bacterium AL-N5]NOK83252.1 hypothetical protein [Chloroflexi bacterium AL-W]NOK87669.1 hypothetical protein [Chloroflexi bacterium AL-N15]